MHYNDLIYKSFLQFLMSEIIFVHYTGPLLYFKEAPQLTLLRSDARFCNCPYLFKGSLKFFPTNTGFGSHGPNVVFRFITVFWIDILKISGGLYYKWHSCKYCQK